MDFQQAEKEFKQIKSQFEAGTMPETEFKAQLEELMVQDEQGNWWMIGYESERWHRYDGANWVQADPPRSFSQIATPVHAATPQTVAKTENGFPQQPVHAADKKAVYKNPQIMSSQKPAGKPLLAVSASRRYYFSFAALAIMIFLAVSVSGYYIYNGNRQKTTQVSSTTDENILPVADVPISQASQTPKPATQASQTPSPTSTPPAALQLSISVSQANLYKGPGLEYGPVQQTPYEKGEKFTALARDPSGLWLLSSGMDGSEGWLYIDWVDLDFDPLLVSTAESIPSLPPTPTRKPKENDPNPPCVFNC